jgi:hypothetical protein
MNRVIFAAAAVVFIAVNVWALDDTPVNRANEADRFLAAKPIKEMIPQMVVQIAARMPAEKRPASIEALIKHLDFAALERGMKDTYVKLMTADELKAAADFYSSPLGQSYNKKLGAVATEFVPVAQAEVTKAQTRAKAERNKEQTQPKQSPNKPSDRAR